MEEKDYAFALFRFVDLNNNYALHNALYLDGAVS